VVDSRWGKTSITICHLIPPTGYDLQGQHSIAPPQDPHFPTAYCLLSTMAGIPLSGMEHPQPRLWGGIPKVKGESETEIPVETLCINNEGEVAKIETICGTFRSSKANSIRN
jgi:hypothetical protein